MSTTPENAPESPADQIQAQEYGDESSDPRDVVAEPPSSKTPLVKQPWFIPAAAGMGGLTLGLVLGLGLGIPIGTAVHAAADRAEESTARSAADGAEQEAAEVRKTFFADAAERCRIRSLVEVVDDGKTLIVDGQGEELFTGDVQFSGLECIIDEVGAPRATKQAMFETRSLDGRPSDSWAVEGIGVEASWSYHPDDGLDIIFEITE